MKLFDEAKRTDSAPRRQDEDSFTFLNRVATPYWEQVRDLLERFYSQYPIEHSESLRRNFRARSAGQHYGAWWELYLHELFRRLGYAITVHPALEGTERRPDFGLQKGASQFLVEASVVFSGIAGNDEETGAAPSWMLAAFEGLKNPDFFVSISEITARGREQLKRSEIATPVEKWLDGLDPDLVAGDFKAHRQVPTLRIERRGWEIQLEASPVKQEARGRSGHRVLGGGPAMAGPVDDVDQLESKLKAKAGRYGRPSLPFVVAVLSLSGFMERRDVEQALFGREAIVISDPNKAGQVVRQRNGFWFRGAAPINTRVSAVVMGIGIQPWSLTRFSPELWKNPWAEYPLVEPWPFPVHTARDSGEVVYSESDLDLGALFELPEPWPVGKPFPRD